jgi:hypothetical protein
MFFRREKPTFRCSSPGDPGNPLEIDEVELRYAKYELHRLCTDPVRGEMIAERKQWFGRNENAVIAMGLGSF